MSLALGDLLICFEMPLFAMAHAYAFCRLDDYGLSLLSLRRYSPSLIKISFSIAVDPILQYVARMPFLLAFRDSIGLLDVYFDFRDTVRGRGINYRSFEPAEGAVHSLGLARERRIRAGLRYEAGGKGSESEKLTLVISRDVADARCLSQSTGFPFPEATEASLAALDATTEV